MTHGGSQFDFNTAALPANLPTPQDNDRRLDDLRSTLRSRAKDVVRDVFPHARIIGHTARIGDLGGAPGESLAIEISGDKAGLWMDHATAESGDLIDLWTATQGYTGDGGFWQAVDDLELHLGLSTGVAWNGPVAKVAEARKRQPAPAPVSKTLEATHVYTDSAGHVLGKVYRYRLSNGKKTFMQQNAAGEWKAPAEPRPLYNQPAIALANTVVMVEGEKCVDRLSALGVEATTVLGGSNVELHRTDWSPIAGKRVILWADNDGEGKTEATSFVGQRYMDRLEPHLRALGCQVVRAVIPAGAPPKWDAADATDIEALTILRGALSRFVDAPANVVDRSMRLLSIDELADQKPPEWLMENMLPEGAFVAVIGPPATMKSFVVLDWALSVAHGRPWLDQVEVKAGGVVYVAGEGQSGVAARIGGWRFSKGEAGVVPFHVLPRSVAVATAELDELMATIATLPERPRLIIFDTLARCFGGGDENSQKDMNAFVAGIDRLRAATGATVLVVHHTGKDGEKGARGSTALPGAVDTLITIKRDDRSITVSNKAPLGKQKEAEEFEDVALTFEPVTFPRRDGEAGSTVVMLLDTAPREDQEGGQEPRQGGDRPQRVGGTEKAIQAMFKRHDDTPFGLTVITAQVGGDKSAVLKALKRMTARGDLVGFGEEGAKRWMLPKPGSG